MNESEALKKALSKLGPDKTIDEYIEYAKALMSVAALESGEGAPAAEAPAPDAAVAAPMGDTGRHEVPLHLASDAAMGEAGALVDALVTSTGLDEGAVLAGLREQTDAIAALIVGQPDSGTAAEAPAAEAAAASVRADKADLAAKAAREEAIALKAARIAAEHEADDARIELAVTRGHLLPTHVESFRALSRSNRAAFAQGLAKASEVPAVPTTTYASASSMEAPAEREVGAGSADLDEKSARNLDRMRRAMRAAKIPDKRIEARIAEILRS